MNPLPTTSFNLAPIKNTKHQAGLLLSSAVVLGAFALLLFVGAALLAVPLALGIVALELERVGRCLRRTKHFLLRPNPMPRRGIG